MECSERGLATWCVGWPWVEQAVCDGTVVTDAGGDQVFAGIAAGAVVRRRTALAISARTLRCPRSRWPSSYVLISSSKMRSFGHKFVLLSRHSRFAARFLLRACQRIPLVGNKSRKRIV